MKVSCLSDNLTIIELSSDEVDFYSLSLSPGGDRDVVPLWEIITDAQKISEREFEDSSELFVDFMPDIKGGCLIIVTENSREDAKDRENSAVIETDNADMLLDFAAALKGISGNTVSALYGKGDNYRLVCSFPKNFPLEVASEFGFKIYFDELTFEKTSEAFECIISCNALEILSGTFLEK